MCSVNDYDCGIDDKPPIISKPVTLLEPKCKKCESKEIVIVLRGKDTYCKSCFLTSATHKFRATLGKSKIVRPNDNILVSHSGKSASSVLLHLIKAGMHESVHKRLIFKSTILYIDEGALEGESIAQRNETINKISSQIKSLGFTGFVTSINESLAEFEPKISPLDSYLATEDEEIKSTFAALPEQSAKEDFLLKLRQKLLVQAARYLNCNKIFTGDSATSLSKSILSNISMGRGAHLSFDVGFTDTRFSDVMILRPIRDFTILEIDHYLRFHNVEVPRLEKCKNSNSIQRLIDDFVTEMETESHGTVSTVLRTGEKLTMMAEKKVENLCALCNASLDTQINSEVCAIQSTDFSRLVSTSVIEPNSGKTETKLRILTNENCSNLEKSCEIVEPNSEKIENGDCNNDCKCKKSCAENLESDVEILRKNLCYGCRLILGKFKDEKSIPAFLINSAKNAISFQKMHEKIADFLL